MGYMLEIKDIYKTFNAGTINEKRALNGVNLNLNPGDFVTIIGGNGAGKSTMMNVLCGLYKPTSGQIFINEKEVQVYGESIKEISSSMVLTSQNFPNIDVRSSLAVCSRIL